MTGGCGYCARCRPTISRGSSIIPIGTHRSRWTRCWRCTPGMARTTRPTSPTCDNAWAGDAARRSGLDFVQARDVRGAIDEQVELHDDAILGAEHAEECRRRRDAVVRHQNRERALRADAAVGLLLELDWH